MWPFTWGKPSDSFCDKEFKPLWTGFVDALVDSFHAQGPAAPPPRPHAEAPERHVHKLPAVKRVVAMGDLHGDLKQMKKVMKAADLVDDNFHWIGGATVAVQVGDQLDRGDEEVQMMYALERLQGEARRAGGALHVLNGNHETMNIGKDLRYATEGGARGFMRYLEAQKIACRLKHKCGFEAHWSEAAAVVPEKFGPRGPEDDAARQYAHHRYAALRPGSTFTRRFFAEHPMVLQVGSNVFVHGGLHPEHLDMSIEAINAETQDWMDGRANGAASDERIPNFLRGADSVVWSRNYSMLAEEKCDCDMLRNTLARLGAERMIMGHTIQSKGVNAVCDNRAVRVDVGMSWGCGFHKPQALEIRDDKHMFRILEDGTRVPLDKPRRPWSLFPHIPEIKLPGPISQAS